MLHCFSTAANVLNLCGDGKALTQVIDVDIVWAL